MSRAKKEKDSSIEGLIISVARLKEKMQEKIDLKIIDLRWYLKGKNGLDEYNSGHIPGAIFLDLGKDITAPSGPGRHPIPSIEQMSQTLSRIGVTKKTEFVIYDDAGGSVAARLWWLLTKYFGLMQTVEVLDGGIQAWIKDGGALSTETPNPKATNFAIEADNIDEEFVSNKVKLRTDRALYKRLFTLLDARAPERYRGEVEPIDARPGHIPGAINAPFSANLNDDGFFKSPKELKAHYKALGVSTSTNITVYCGSGVTACHDILALYIAGYDDPSLYEGSWSDWARDPYLPAKLGNEP
jgi:thiosulfate/3-mercaptopyruvate sulfurtransferase